MDIIYHVSHAILAHKKSVASLISEVFEVLKKDMNLQRGALTLKRENELVIEASIGLSAEEKRNGHYKLGEGITGKVGETGKSIIIPDISKEPAFLGRTGKRSGKTAFICVPVINNNEVIGTLSIDSPFATEEKLNEKRKLLEIIANITADGIGVLRSEIEEREALILENQRLKAELSNLSKPDSIVGNCNRMRMVYGLILQVAPSPATVLIRGESGTGKELVAKAIHDASPRKAKPFIAVNCAALPENLIESELFGHEKGSFTGANYARKGRFELADGGTIFLDEIGDISLSTQVKLLRIIQEKVFERVGSNNPIKVNVRIIAATSRNLEEYMTKGKFREDLYYRLNVFPIYLPALRERKTDIILLADYFLEKYNNLYIKNIRRISSPAINMLMSYHWPGNVRELENTIERAILVSNDEVINAYDLPPSLQTAKETRTSLIEDGKTDFLQMVAAFEEELIVEAIKDTNGNVAAAARKLGITPRIIHYKIRILNINAEQYRVINSSTKL